MTKTDLTPANIMRLADIHIQRYAGMVRSAIQGYGRNIRKDECLMYLNIWQGISDKGGEWSHLDPKERNEVRDAIESGE